jgi:hypothetical protein
MGISTTNADLFRAILAMDAYNRGYNAGIKSPNAGPDQGLTGTMIGLASVGTASSSALNSAERNASFFAQAYSFGTGAEVGAALRGKTIISYRGTES